MYCLICQIADGLLYIVEQMPGIIESQDVTNILRRGYWASYNVPAIESIYNISGNGENAQEHGTSLSYDLAPRARLFRAYANKIGNFSMFKTFMRYNDYKNNPLENNDPSWAIMSRFDLDPILSYPGGGIDSKLTSYSKQQDNLAVIVKSGPTNDNVPTFSWTQFKDMPNVAMPKSYDFDWFEMISSLS